MTDMYRLIEALIQISYGKPDAFPRDTLGWKIGASNRLEMLIAEVIGRIPYLQVS